jgi:23S rRNA (uracil1939-C5)-methyltransferase
MACSEEENAWATARSGSEVREGISILIGNRTGEEVVLGRRIGEFLYSVTASVFFQANDFMVPKLMALVRESAGNAGDRCALDLFAGVGLFSLPLACQFGEVMAVENSPAATGLLAQNARKAGFRNIQAVCADVSAWMESLSIASDSMQSKFDLIVLDPPRAGAGPGIMKKIGEWAPKTIIYVSCDPQTLIRDLAEISPRDYAIDLVKGLDMFPQTYHFETVARLRRKSSR